MENLTKQIFHPVKWCSSVEYMKNQGIHNYLEFGPKKVLGRLIKQIDKNCKVYQVGNKDDILKVKEAGLEEKPDYMEFMISVDLRVEHPMMKDVKIICRQKSREELSLFREAVYETYHLTLDESLAIAFSLAVSSVFHVSTLNLEIESQGRDHISETCNTSRTMGWFTRIYSVCLPLSCERLNTNVKLLKERLREARERAKQNNLEWPHKGERNVRFNYLGDVGNETNYSEFTILENSLKIDTDEENEFQPLLDVNIMLQKEHLQIEISYCVEEFYETTMNILADEFLNQIDRLTENCKTETEVTFTTSDFYDSDISQDDLDILF